MRALSSAESSILLVLAVMFWVPRVSGQVDKIIDSGGQPSTADTAAVGIEQTIPIVGQYRPHSPLGTTQVAANADSDSKGHIEIEALPSGTSVRSNQDSPNDNRTFIDFAPKPPLSAQRSQQSLSNSFGDGPPIFIENKGQFDSRVKFQVSRGSKTLWLTNNGIVFDVVRPKPAIVKSQPRSANSDDWRRSKSSALLESERTPIDHGGYERLVFSQDLVAANVSPILEASGRKAGLYNYFLGNDPTKWVTDAKGYSEVTYRNVWQGVDLKLSSNGRDIEQEFLVHPGAALDQIQVAYRGIDRLDVDAAGDLKIRMAFGDLTETPPRIYQQISGRTEQIAGRFKLLSRSAYTFETEKYSRDYALLIDPTLEYSTFLGGSFGSSINAVAVDSSGSAYVTGSTVSQDFPVTPNSFQNVSPNNVVAFVSKLHASGNSLAYSTYLSGTGGDGGSGIAVDSGGNAFITGWTSSADFPVTQNPFLAHGGTFLTKLGANGDTLSYSTYLTSSGGSALSVQTYLPGIAVDGAGNAYIVGATTSILKMNASGSNLVYSYLLNASAIAIAVDAQGNSYVTGNTGAPLGTSLGNGCSESFATFVSKINPSGTAPVYNVTICQGAGLGIAVDSSGSAFVTGLTSDASFPVTAGAFQTTKPSASSNTFVAKINPFGTGLVYATYLDGDVSSALLGSCFYAAGRIAVDATGDAYVAGCTASTNFPITQDALLPNHSVTVENGFISVLDPTGSTLVYSTYLGGSGLTGNYVNVGTRVNGVAVDAGGNATVVGQTDSIDFPITPGAFQQVNLSGTRLCSGCGSGFITNFNFSQGQLSPSVMPQFVGNSGVVSLTIFLPNGVSQDNIPTVVLTAPNEPDIVATSVLMVDGNHILAIFDLTGVHPGVRTLVVTYPSGDKLTLQQALDITTGGAPALWADIVGFSKIRAGQPQAYYLAYGNHGTTDSQQPFTLWVTFPTFLSWTLPDGRVPDISYTSDSSTVLGFDVFDTIAVGSIRIIPLMLTLPDLPQYAHIKFEMDMWSPSF